MTIVTFILVLYIVTFCQLCKDCSDSDCDITCWCLGFRTSIHLYLITYYNKYLLAKNVSLLCCLYVRR